MAAAEPAGITQVPDVGDDAEWVIAIHGGAGSASRSDLSPEREKALRAALQASLRAGGRILTDGGSGPLAIEAALNVLEDSPLFNAGRGAALDEHGTARHDASIMRGEDLAAGAIAGSSRIRNPITAALAVMEETDNVMLHGEGADWFAAESGLAMESPVYFVTEERRKVLLEARARNPGQVAMTATKQNVFGTVGAVVLDKHGNISAGTSTGGRTNKRFGRIGDSPVIGAGTYASNSSCAISATGHGEYFMRWTVARDICARVEFVGESLEDAADHVIVDTLMAVKGYGAVIGLDPNGVVVFSGSTANLKRGVMSSSTAARVAIYSDEEIK